jgi:mono/diheme cytochrome c family protein
MKQTILLFSLFVFVSIPVLAAPSDVNGKVVFEKWCAPCHGAVGPRGGALPGTAALAVKYKGRVPAVLEERTDLPPSFIKTVVRHGLFAMPITRKTEVNDAELEAVVAYLTRNRKP